MIAGKHFDDDDLLELIASAVDPASNEHLAACEECHARFDSFGMVAGTLRDESVWDERPLSEAPVPSTIAHLRAFADQMAAEDSAAATALASLLATPSETWSATPLPQTAGMVRKLIEASEQTIDTAPPDAVTLASLATTLAAALPATAYTSDTIPKAAAAAHRQHAYALFYTGSFAAAEEALCAAERHLSDCVVDEYDGARLGIVRASVERALEKYEIAIRAAQKSAGTFMLFEDSTRVVSAHLAEVNLLFSTGRLNDAYATLTSVKEHVEKFYDPDLYARVLGNLGYCCWRLGRSAEALVHQEASAALFDELGNPSAATRARWNVAKVLASAGQFDEAIVRFLRLRVEFTHLGMMASATQSGLDAAELLVERGRFDDVEAICRNVMQELDRAKVAYTVPALMALSLMNEAAARRTATATLVRHVRDYVAQIPKQPNLVFALPPE